MKTESLYLNNIFCFIISCFIILTAGTVCYGSENDSLRNFGYSEWETIGRLAAEKSLNSMKKAGAAPERGNIIVVTNAGYAEVNGSSTQGALDGLAGISGASRGKNTLVEIHSAPWVKLWFALYDRASGLCSYMEVNPGVTGYPAENLKTRSADLFNFQALEKISFEYMNAHADEYASKFENKIFGGNEFRVISIVNAIAEGAPTQAVRAFEFHDHYCPGVTSGIMMAGYIKGHFSPDAGDDYFVQAVDPWCKEDALILLLNATPGKGAYAVNYPSDSDLERLPPEVRDASTIFYLKDNKTGKWKGFILAFEWADTGCDKSGNSLIDKICADLWYLKHIDKPGNFVKVVKRFELPEGVEPDDYARPGINPMEELELTISPKR